MRQLRRRSILADLMSVQRALLGKSALRSLAGAVLAASAATTSQQAYALKLNTDHFAAAPTRVENSIDPSFVAALARACPDILSSPAEYDDALIALCLKAWRRP
jgi:hypothetical protein